MAAGRGNVSSRKRDVSYSKKDGGFGESDVSRVEFERWMGLEKKRKILGDDGGWNRDEKEVRVLSRNRANNCSRPFELVGVGEDECRVDNLEESQGFLGKNGVGKKRPVSSDAFEAPLSLKSISCYEPVVEGDKLLTTWRGLKSRWADGLGTPEDQFSCGEEEAMPAASDSEMSSPESGEILGGRSSTHEIQSQSMELMVRGDDYLVKDLRMEIDEVGDESAAFHGLESDNDLIETESRNRNMFQGCRSAFDYEKLHKISEGTYGIVYKARDKLTGDIVALKKVKMERQTEGFPITSLREINILMSLRHSTVVDVREVVMDDHDGVFVVMEYMEHDLKQVMNVMKQPFSQSEVKCLMLQLLEGVKFLHDNWVLHRDLKTSNILFNNRGELKICDFGMARQYGSPSKPYTSEVVTLWYRAPELLLGAQQYSTALDMWSVGCIMAEMLSKKPLFNGESEIKQLNKIFDVLGTPNDTIWHGYSSLPWFSSLSGKKMKFANRPFNLRERFPAASFTASPVLTELGFDLLCKLLTYDPEKRITAEEALNHPWFQEMPLPKTKEFMPTFPVRKV